jgi:hypothetical protein
VFGVLVTFNKELWSHLVCLLLHHVKDQGNGKENCGNCFYFSYG